MKKLLLILCIIFSVSCATQKRCLNKFPYKETIDSIYIETIKEVKIPLPGDTVKVDVPVNCPDQDLIDVENSRLRQTIKILNGKLVANTLIKPDTIKVNVVETLIKVKEVKVPQPVKYIPKFFWYCVIFSAFVIGYTALRFLKK